MVLFHIKDDIGGAYTGTSYQPEVLPRGLGHHTPRLSNTLEQGVCKEREEGGEDWFTKLVAVHTLVFLGRNK